MSYVREPLSNLSVLNNFMFNKLSSDSETKERFSKLLVKGLIGIELDEIVTHTEQMIFPDDPDKKGVRLDLQIDSLSNKGVIKETYDIEPHTDKRVDYPKYSRYRQALIDKDSLPSGSNNYDLLPGLYIINITNYDPFGYGYMVYSIKNQCIEVPELCYNDDVTIYYFNTRGELGGTDSLKGFLTYLEKSTDDNVVDDVTKEIHEFVDIIKRKSGGEYMTLGDWVDNITKDMSETIERQKEVLDEKNLELSEKDLELARKDEYIKQLEEKLSLLSCE